MLWCKHSILKPILHLYVSSKKWNECAMQPMEDTKEDSENDDDESSSTAAQMQDNAADLPESVKK